MSRVNLVKLDSPSTVEKLRATVYTTADPTGGAVEWQLTAVGSKPASDGWDAGAWDGSYNADNDRATAVSPLVVATLGATTGARYTVWIRWTAGAETPERIAGELLMG